MGVTYDVKSSPVFQSHYEPPWKQFDYTLPELHGTTSFQAHAYAILSWHVGVYEGLIEANIGLKSGPELYISGGTKYIGSTAFPRTVDAFGLDIRFAIPLSATAVYGAIDIGETDLYSTTWPIIGLPRNELKKLYDHACGISACTDETSASFSLSALEHYPTQAVVGNHFTGSATWRADTAMSDGWKIVAQESNRVYFRKEFAEKHTETSSPPDGTVYVVQRPQFPPSSYVMDAASLDVMFPGGPQTCPVIDCIY